MSWRNNSFTLLQKRSILPRPRGTSFLKRSVLYQGRTKGNILAIVVFCLVVTPLRQIVGRYIVLTTSVHVGPQPPFVVVHSGIPNISPRISNKIHLAVHIVAAGVQDTVLLQATGIGERGYPILVDATCSLQGTSCCRAGRGMGVRRS